MLKKFYLTASLILLWSGPLFAQDDTSDNEELQIIEVELEKSQNQRQRPSTPDAQAPAATKSEDMNFSGLGTLAPFSEVSVIQKRFLPKTNRMQFFGGFNMVTNNPFFETFGIVGRAAYFINESFGLEANYFSLTTNEAKATQELKSFQNVNTDNLIYPKNYMGLDLMWFPMYGKFTLFNKSIVPFDMYFSAGYGTIKTQSEKSPGSFHIGTGQIFAITKGTAIRWDFSWHNFADTGVDGNTSNFNLLFLSLGASFFFPEAKYR